MNYLLPSRLPSPRRATSCCRARRCCSRRRAAAGALLRRPRTCLGRVPERPQPRTSAALRPPPFVGTRCARCTDLLLPGSSRVSVNAGATRRLRCTTLCWSARCSSFVRSRLHFSALEPFTLTTIVAIWNTQPATKTDPEALGCSRRWDWVWPFGVLAPCDMRPVRSTRSSFYLDLCNPPSRSFVSHRVRLSGA